MEGWSMKIPRIFAKQRNSRAGAKQAEWKEIEYFDPFWEQRVVELAKMIQGKGRLVDFGCGRQYLRKHLPGEVQYIPVDYKTRSPDTIVADFNNLPYPRIDAEIAFISGFLEYVRDVPSFIRHLEQLSYREIVMSYCTLETITSLDERIALGWKNHLSLSDLLTEFLRAFNLHQIGCFSRNALFRFERKI
jgi:hypothetical protein